MRTTIEPFEGQNVRHLLDCQCALRGDHEFLVWIDREGTRQSWTYLEFRREVDRIAGGLLCLGLQPGDFVCVHMDNRPEFLFGWFAVQSLGAVMVATNTRSSVDELRYYLSKANVRFVLTDSEHLLQVRRSAEQHANVVALDAPGPDWPAAPTDVSYPDVDALAIAGVQFTSGTTSRPKGVVWTHANYLWGARAMAAHEQLTSDDRHFTHLPLFHTNAQIYSVMATLWAGGTVVLVPRFSASRFWAIALSERTTWTSMVYFTLRALMGQAVPTEHHFRAWGVPSLSSTWHAHFGVPMVSWWGMTETVTPALVSRLNEPLCERSVGRPAPGFELRLRNSPVSEDGDGATTGVLEVRAQRGIVMALGYLDDEEADRAWDDEGWFDTGDRLRLDRAGWLEFVGRDKDMLKVGGENVAPAEIERVISSVDGVREVAVVGMADPLRGEVPVAFVVAATPAGNATDEGLVDRVLATCRVKLADFKVPRLVTVVDDLPRSTLGKVAKAALRKSLEDAMSLQER